MNIEGYGRSHNGFDSPLLRQYEQYSPSLDKAHWGALSLYSRACLGLRCQPATHRHEPLDDRHFHDGTGDQQVATDHDELGSLDHWPTKLEGELIRNRPTAEAGVDSEPTRRPIRTYYLATRSCVWRGVLRIKLNLPSVGRHLHILECENTTPPRLVTTVS